jgi:carbonic anhydrase/acetyltransferase-like protein (isoleucine patch superfamily)
LKIRIRGTSCSCCCVDPQKHPTTVVVVVSSLVAIDIQSQTLTNMSIVEGGGEGYIKTTTHNYVSRKAVIDGAKQVEIKGRSILHDGVHVRGDLQIVRIGRYCEIGLSTILQPPVNAIQRKGKYIPMVIGSHTHIGESCEIRSSAIGSSE